MKKLFLIAGLLLLLNSCTSIEVKPLPSGVDEVVVLHNPKVQVDDFENFIVKRLTGAGIKTSVSKESYKDYSKFVLSYTARRTWDIVTYLSEADIVVEKGGREVGRAHYHLRGKGGLSLLKWQGVETKMTPVLDELLKNN